MNYKQIAFIGLVTLSTQACNQKDKSEVQAKGDVSEWAKLDSFHLKLSEVYHPYADSGDLGPVKLHAEELALEADSWIAATLPDHVNQNEVKEKLDKLRTDSHTLSDLIHGEASDDEISSSLIALHDSFHALMEAWNKGVKEGREQ